MVIHEFPAIFLDFLIFLIFMILRCSGYEFRLPGLISCPGQVPNRPGMEFQANSDFRVHMLFMRRPNYQPNCLKNGPQTTALRQNAASISAVGRKIGPQSIELSDFTHTSL